MAADALPQVRDDRFEYQAIDDDHLDNEFGPFMEYLDGRYVPAPHLVEGTRTWADNRARLAEAEAEKEAAAAAKVKAPKVRAAAAKRKPQGQPEGQPAPPKKVTRTSARQAQLLPPAEITAPLPAKGLLAAAKQAAAEAAAGEPAAEEASSPEASTPRDGDVGVSKARMSPKLPKNALPPDEYGVRVYTQRAQDKSTHRRFILPRAFTFKPHEIGFRDSTNDQTRHKTKAVNKYTGTPNSSATHLDHRVVDYDFSHLGSDDFDQELIERHRLHPHFGLVLPGSVNEKEEPSSYVMPGKPVVFIANPSSRVAHASRSFQDTTTQRSAEEAPLRIQISTALRRYCKKADVGPEDVAITDYLESDQAMRARSLGTADRELQASASRRHPLSSAEQEKVEERQEETSATKRQEHDGRAGDGAAASIDPTAEQRDGSMTALFVLAYATAFEEAKDATRSTPSASKTSRYDAVRDVFTSSRPSPAPVPEDDTLGLNFLARVCNVEPRLPGPARPVDEAPVADAAADSNASRAAAHGEAPSVAPQAHDAARKAGGQLPATPSTRKQLLGSVVLQSASVARPERPTYPAQREVGMQQHLQTRNHEFSLHRPLPPQPPPPPPPAAAAAAHQAQDQNAYYSSSPVYPTPNHRDAHMAPGRSIDTGFASRGVAGYGSEGPSPAQSYGGLVLWPQRPQPGPSPIAPAAVPVQHQYPPLPAAPAATHYRIPFSHNASAEPLPPLRPPRSRSQSVHEDSIHDARLRPGLHAGTSPYYPHGLPRAAFPRSYTESSRPERVLSASHHAPQQQAYMGSPSAPSYAHQAPTAMSPTYGNPAPVMVGQMGQQSPPDTPLPALHHRATPSNEAANGKYRRLEPAPMPAHRAWSHKPELKTIFYDHKETGSSAALPNSGPTQIRGWSVNQSRKRSRQDKADYANEREESR